MVMVQGMIWCQCYKTFYFVTDGGIK